MGLAVSGARVPDSAGASGSLSAQQLVEIYRLMYLSRRLDDREILLKRQQKIFFQISAAGHEALQVGAGLALRPGYDWFFPYYRDRALCLALGLTPDVMMLQAVGAGTDPEICLRTFQAAAEHCRAGLGPAFVHGHCVRAYSHSLSDEDRLYPSTAEREADALRDPIAKMQMRLLREGILTEAQINELEQSQDHLAAEAAERALEAPLPEVSEILKHVYSEDLDPTGPMFDHEHADAPGGAGGGKTGSA